VPDTDRIPEALRKFKIPSEVVNVITGPRLSRVLVKPYEITNLSRVLRIEDELAFFLHVPKVRIDLLPELGLISMEIPNTHFTPLHLTDLLPLQDEGPFSLPAGIQLDGEAVWFSLAKAPHLLVAGTTGSGKSTFLNQLLTATLMCYTPEQVRIVLVDLKRGVEFGAYEGVPHLWRDNAYSPEQAHASVQNLIEIMDSRYWKLSQAHARSIDEPTAPEMYRILVVIDELAALVSGYPELQADIIRLAQLGRAAGIHLVLSTQHPSRDVINGQLKSNVIAAIMRGRCRRSSRASRPRPAAKKTPISARYNWRSFATSSRVDSSIILDKGGAEKLLGNGDAILQLTGKGERRLSGAQVSHEETTAVVDWWRQAR